MSERSQGPWERQESCLLNWTVWFWVWGVLVVQCCSFLLLVTGLKSRSLGDHCPCWVYIWCAYGSRFVSWIAKSFSHQKGFRGLFAWMMMCNCGRLFWHLFSWKEGDVCVYTCGKGIWHFARPSEPEFSSGSASSSWHHCTCLQLSLSFLDAFDHWHCLILVQHLCKTRNLEVHLTSIKGF